VDEFNVNDKMQNRIDWIDWAKVIGIWIVVYGHTPGHLFGQVIFLFHMPLFFIISGMLYKQRPVVHEIQRSLYSLILPYFIYNAIITIITPPGRTNGHYC